MRQQSSSVSTPESVGQAGSAQSSGPDPTATRRYRFVGFELLPRERVLLRDGQPAAVGPRAFDVLVALVERAGRLVTKDELLERAWPGLVVEENNLQVQVSTLRKVLGASAILTVPGHGYRFTRAVAAERDDETSLPASRGVPRPATRFVGRATELSEIEKQLEGTRLLTLVGVGGIGKTRLSIELAAAVAGRFPDGVAFIELAPLEDPRSVVGAVASTLGVKPDAKRQLLDALVHHLADRTQLVVLDNCEHLLGASASIASELLRSCKGVKLLATSREALRIPGETVYAVPTLPSPHAGSDHAPGALRQFPSVALFVDRACAFDREFAVTRDNAADLARICATLEGIPLAIELAASRLRSMSVRTIAEHLGEQVRLLAGGDRSALPRQHTMRAAIEWSYHLLSEPERSVFRRLCVFAGGFEVDAAQAVGAGNGVAAGDVLYVLAELVDKSLIAFEPASSRYRMLEPVRQYALVLLAEAGEEAEARDAHLRFHVAWARSAGAEIRTRRQQELTRRIVAERDNFAIAFAHARDKSDGGPDGLAMVFPTIIALLIAGHLDLCRRILHEALTHPGAQEDSVDRCRALLATAWGEFVAGRYDEVHALASEGVLMARRCRDDVVLADAMVVLATASLCLGRNAEARQCNVEILEWATRVGNASLASDAHDNLGDLESLDGELELAQGHYLESLRLNPDESGSTDTVYNLARNEASLGREEAALQYLRQALGLQWPGDTTVATQAILCQCAWAATRRGDPQRALRWFGAAAAHRESIGFKSMEPDASIYERVLQRAREAAGPSAGEAFAGGIAMHESEAAIGEAVAWLATLPD